MAEADWLGHYAPPFYRQPQFAPNVNMLLVIAGGSEITQFELFDPVSGEKTGFLTNHDCFTTLPNQQ